MDSLDLSNNPPFTSEQLADANEWSTEQWQQNIPKLSPDQIAIILPIATPQHDPNLWKDKIHTVIEVLKTPQQLEAVGRTATIEQTSEILSWINSKQVNQPKLFSLFLGMPQIIFLQLLVQATPEEQNILKQESLSEPIQHHLTLLTHELSSASTSHNQAFSALEMQLRSLDLETTDSEQINELEKIIELFRDACLSTQFLSSKALAIAWNSGRTDLIEKLSSFKEQSQKLSNDAIGQSSGPDASACGLYEIFENRLNSVFNDDNNNPLSDDEPTIEALVKFSIWYIKDYWEIGLLPHISQAQLELELAPSAAIKDEGKDFRKQLFDDVHKNLEKLGLVNLQNLKKNKIYSKTALKNYILSHQNILN
ncbi:MAG: hypothetical protein H0X29_05690 [Parachlamydiaceae bacterium]|nr:hypothetical protein [Parachlamydiaceae bacterium]